MKGSLLRKALSTVTVMAMMFQLIPTIGVNASEELPSPYKKTEAFANCNGEQGYDGWYYMYKAGENDYVNMTWDGQKFSAGDNNVNVHAIQPAWCRATAIGWQAQYTGTVTLTPTDSIVYRMGAYAGGGDVTATIRLNGEIIKQNDGTDAQWVFDKMNNQNNGAKNYKIENVKVNKGDMIYFEVDCGENNGASDIYWKPEVIYTELTSGDKPETTPEPGEPEEPTPLPEFKMVDDIKASDEQGYNGWHYMYKTSTGYADMGTRTSDDGGKWSEGDNWVNFFQAQPAWGRATAIGWQAPYSGTVTLTRTGNFQRLSKGNGDVTATVFLNEDVLKQNDGTDAQWIFGKDENWDDGPDRSYEITGVKVKAGDWIYHVLDCGENNGSPNIQWQPMITYTALTSGDEPEEPELPSPYKKTEAFANCNGEQGYDGWYYMYKAGENDYVNMTWDGQKFSAGDNNVNVHAIQPAWCRATAIGWQAQYTGTVTLTPTDSIVYRMGAYAGGGDVTATIRLNGEIIKQNDGTDAQWVFDKMNNQNNGAKNYKIENVKVNKGDMIYFEVDCGENNGASDIYWKPEVIYTELTSGDEPEEPEQKSLYKKTEAFANCNGEQGYDGWYYMYKAGENNYVNMTWDGNRFSAGANNVNVHAIQPAYCRATAIGWEVPYSGTVTLTPIDNIVYRMLAYADGGDVTATIKLNGEILKQNDGTDAQWVFDKTNNHDNGAKTYKIENVKVNKGDMIYYEVDCGEKNGGSDIYWKPQAEYTYFEPYHIEGDGTKENPYLISSVKDVNSVAEISEQSEEEIFAKITGNVTLNKNSKIGKFTGTIDGNNNKITLAGNPFIEKASGDVTIQNLMIDGTVKGSENVASFIGYTDAASVTLENCANLANVTADDNAAGFVGYVNDGDSVKMTNCYNYGTVISSGSTVNPCANTSIYANEEYINCYYLENSANYNKTKPYNSAVITSKTATEFGSGEVAYLLGSAFGQKLTSPADKYPVFRTDSNGVYKKGSGYSNTLLETSELSFNMSSSFPSNGEQGKDNWYYTYKSPETGEYIQLKWYSNGNDKRFVNTDNNGNITNFVTANGILHPAGGVPVDVGWKAPMSGKVRLTTGTPIRKISNGAPVGAKIVLNDNVIWKESIAGDLTDEKLGKTYDIVVDVNIGETIYFQIDCTDASSAGTLWVPQVKYLQTAKFMSDGEKISSAADIKDGKSIECLFYDEGQLEKDVLIYLAAYDETGSMRRISDPHEVSGKGVQGCSVKFDADFNAGSYENWELRLMVINGDGININPIIKPELYCVK